jgi:hypothetical protein
VAYIIANFLVSTYFERKDESPGEKNEDAMIGDNDPVLEEELPVSLASLIAPCSAVKVPGGVGNGLLLEGELLVLLGFVIAP